MADNTPNDDGYRIQIYADQSGETHVDSSMSNGQTPSAMILAALAVMEQQEGHPLTQEDFLQICQTLWSYHQTLIDPE